MPYITKTVAAAVAAARDRSHSRSIGRALYFLTFVFLSLHRILILYQLCRINFLCRSTELILIIHCFKFTEVETERKIGFHQTLQGKVD